MAFGQENALDKLEGFASEFGPRFYGLPLNEGSITLVREPQSVPERLELAGGSGEPVALVPFHAGETLPWRIAA
jgi:dihydroorotase